MLHRYQLKPDTSEILKITTTGCLLVKTDPFFLKTILEKKTLADIFNELPVITTGLYSLAINYNTKMITQNMLIEFYAGDIHIEDAHQKIKNNNNYLIPKSKIKLNDRLTEIGLNFFNMHERLKFFASDIAQIGTIINIKNNLAHIQVIYPKGEIIYKYIIVPQLSLRIGDKVLFHLGYIIKKITQTDDKISKKIKSIQKNNNIFQTNINSLITQRVIQIDNRAIGGCNLTKIQFFNFYPHATLPQCV